MNTLNAMRRWRTWLVLALALTITACASTPAGPPDVKVRAQERLDLLIGQDYAAVYQYLSPAVRSSVSSVAYQRQLLLQKVQWSEAHVVSSDCLEDLCKVKISFKYVIFAPVPGMKQYQGNRVKEENWIFTEGNWWLSLDL
jgi:hypothetical protein